MLVECTASNTSIPTMVVEEKPSTVKVGSHFCMEATDGAYASSVKLFKIFVAEVAKSQETESQELA